MSGQHQFLLSLVRLAIASRLQSSLIVRQRLAGNPGTAGRHSQKDSSLKDRKREILLLFKGRLRSSGSRYMRCDQMAEFMNRYCGDRYCASVGVLPKPDEKPARWKKLLKHANGAVVVGLKGTLDALSDEPREELRAASLALGIDHVDSFAGGSVFQMADLHIAASEAAHRFMRKKCERIARRDGFDMPRIELVDHHADMRVTASPQPPASAPFRIAYIGNLDNTFIPAEIESDVMTFSDMSQKGFETILSEIPAAHMHYCVRSKNNPRRHKPFTKGFVAAQADRNLIVSPAVPDAIRFLGNDYPFMAKGESADAIIETTRMARASIGSDEWLRGLERIRATREAVTPEKIAAQFAALLDGFY